MTPFRFFLSYTIPFGVASFWEQSYNFLQKIYLHFTSLRYTEEKHIYFVWGEFL